MPLPPPLTKALQNVVGLSAQLCSIVINCTRGHHSSNIDVFTIDPDGWEAAEAFFPCLTWKHSHGKWTTFSEYNKKILVYEWYSRLFSFWTFFSSWCIFLMSCGNLRSRRSFFFHMSHVEAAMEDNFLRIHIPR